MGGPSGGAVACKRNMDCKCPECVAASAAFSVDDLRSITSNIRYDLADDSDEENGGLQGNPPPPASSVSNSPPLPAIKKAAGALARPSRKPMSRGDSEEYGEAAETSSALASSTPSSKPAAAEASAEGKENDGPRGGKAAVAKAAAAPPAPASAHPPSAPGDAGMAAVRMDFDASSAGSPAAAPQPRQRMSSASKPTPRQLGAGMMRMDSRELPDSSTMAFPASVPRGDSAFATPAAAAGAGDMAATLSASEAAALDIRPEDVDQASLPARLTDKNWKTRREAYLELRALLEAAGAGTVDTVGPEVFEAMAPHVPKAVDDSNASALDAALDAALAFVEHARPASLVGPALAEALVPRVINRALPGRPSTLKKGQALLLKLMEVDTPEATVLALLEKGLGDKRPKVPPACLQSLQEGLGAFGPKHFPFKALKGVLKPLFESSQKAVRTAAMDLVVEVCRWVGMSPLKDIVDDLRPAQQKEIADATADVVPGQVQPSVGLRRYRGQAAQADGPGAAGAAASGRPGADHAAGGSGGGGGGDLGGAGDFHLDPYELADPVDLLAKLNAPGAEFWSRLQAAKWSERVEALTLACKAVGDVPKLVPGDYAELVRALKQQVGHSHFQVATGAIRLLGLLGSGLREKFYPYAPSVWALLLGKAKDKKVLAAASEAMDQLYGKALPLEAVLEDVDAGVDAKKATVPHTRVLMLEWVGRSLAASTAGPGAAPKGCKYYEVPAAVKLSLAKTLVRCMEDSDPKVREATHATARRLLEAAAAGGAGEQKAVLAVYESLRSTNKKAYDRLVYESGADAGSSSGSGCAPSRAAAGGGVSLAAAAGPRAGTAKPAGRTAASRAGGAGGGATAKRPGPLASKASASSGAPGSAAGARKATNGGLSSSAAVPQDDRIDEGAATVDPEEAGALLQEALKLEEWEEAIVAPLRGSNWTARKDALARLREAVVAHGSALVEGSGAAPSSSLLAALLAFVGEHSKKFKDSNVNVAKEALEVALAGMGALVGDAPSAADKAAAVLMIPVAVEKLLDKKLKDTACALLTAAAEVVGPGPVAARVMKGAAAAKAPALHAEALGWLKACAVEFGASRTGVQALAAFAVSEVEGSSNPAVRKAGVDLLGAMYRQIGPPLRSVALPEGIKPAVRTAVEQEFDKVGFSPGSAQKGNARKVKGEPAAGAGGGAGEGLGLPRLDLGPQLKELLARMGCADGKNAWQTRKVAIEEVMALCENSGRYVEANKAAAEVLKALRARLADSQSNLKPLAAQAIADLVCSLEEAAAAKYARLVAEALLNGAADNKKVMRDACIQAVDRILSVGKGPAVVEALLPQLAAAMLHAVGRTELLQCLAKFLPHISCDAAVLAAPLLDSLQDKTATARAAAETCLMPLLSSGVLKQQALNNGMRDFAPAVKRSLVAPLARVQAQAEAAASATGPPSTAPTGQDLAAEQQDDGTSPATTAAPAAATAAAGPPAASSSAATGGSLSKKEEVPATAAATKPGRGLEEEGPACGLIRGNKGKAKREEDFRRMRWVTPPDEARPEDMEALKIAWAPMLSAGEGGALERLFPPSVRRGKGFAVDPTVYLGGVEVLAAVLEESLPVYTESLDLAFRWLALRLCDKENVQVLQRVLELLVRSLERLKEAGYALRDFEAAILVPHVLEKSGQGKERFRVLFRQAMRLLCDVYPFSKYAPFVVNALASKNLRTRTACLDELRRILDFNSASPTALLGKRGLREVARYLDSREPDVRSAALELMLEVHERAGRDMGKLARATDGGLSDKGRALLEEKARDRERGGRAGGGGSRAEEGGSGGLDRSGAGSTASGSRIPGPGSAAHSRQSSVNASEGPGGEALLVSGAAGGGGPANSAFMVLSQMDGNLDLRLTSSASAGAAGSSNALGSAKKPRPPASGGLLRSPSPRMNLRLDANPPEDGGSGSGGGGGGGGGGGLFQFRTDDITYGDEPSLLEEAHGGGAGAGVAGTGAFDATLTTSLADAEPPASYLRLLAVLDSFLAARAPVGETDPERAAVLEVLAVLTESPRPSASAGGMAPESAVVLEEEALRVRGDELVGKVVEVLAKAFSCADASAAAAAGVAPALQTVDALLAEAAARAITALYRNAEVVLQVSPTLVAKTLEEGLWRAQADPALTALAASGDKVAAALSLGMRKAMGDVFKSLPTHTCLAALLDSMTRQRRQGASSRAPGMAAAVAAFNKVVRAERMGQRPFEGMDVAKLVGPLASFGRTPEEAAAVGQFGEAEAAVVALLEALLAHYGREKIWTYLQMGGVDALDSGSELNRYLAQLAAAKGADGVDAMDGVGSFALSSKGMGTGMSTQQAAPSSSPPPSSSSSDIAKLVADVLNPSADNSENLKRLHALLSARAPLSFTEQLKPYNLSPASLAHLIKRLGDLGTSSSPDKTRFSPAASSAVGASPSALRGVSLARLRSGLESGVIGGGSPRSSSTGPVLAASLPFTLKGGAASVASASSATAASTASKPGTMSIQERIKQLKDQLDQGAVQPKNSSIGASSSSGLLRQASAPRLPVAGLDTAAPAKDSSSPMTSLLKSRLGSSASASALPSVCGGGGGSTTSDAMSALFFDTTTASATAAAPVTEPAASSSGSSSSGAGESLKERFMKARANVPSSKPAAPAVAALSGTIAVEEGVETAAAVPAPPVATPHKTAAVVSVDEDLPTPPMPSRQQQQQS